MFDFRGVFGGEMVGGMGMGDWGFGRWWWKDGVLKVFWELTRHDFMFSISRYGTSIILFIS